MEEDYINVDPGCTRHGNFKNYYDFNFLKSRLELIPENILSTLHNLRGDILVLDIGCNSGDLTIGLYDYLKLPHSINSINILAIDIDGHLIERCLNKLNSYNNRIVFKKANIMNTSDRKLIIEEYLLEKNATKFDLILAFSLTMWIHINNGDLGLMNFFDYLISCGHYLIIEPQPWRCYKNAERRNKRSIKLTNKILDYMITHTIDFLSIDNDNDEKQFNTLDIVREKSFQSISCNQPSRKIEMNIVLDDENVNLNDLNIDLKNLKWTHKVDDLIIEYLTKNGMTIVQHFGRTKWGRGIFLLKNSLS